MVKQLWDFLRKRKAEKTPCPQIAVGIWQPAIEPHGNVRVRVELPSHLGFYLGPVKVECARKDIAFRGYCIFKTKREHELPEVRLTLTNLGDSQIERDGEERIDLLLSQEAQAAKAPAPKLPRPKAHPYQIPEKPQETLSASYRQQRVHITLPAVKAGATAEIIMRLPLGGEMFRADAPLEVLHDMAGVDLKAWCFIDREGKYSARLHYQGIAGQGLREHHGPVILYQRPLSGLGMSKHHI